jgi:hypothetical protein
MKGGGTEDSARVESPFMHALGAAHLIRFRQITQEIGRTGF